MKKIRLLLDMSVTEESAGILFALDHVKEQVEVSGISLCFGRVSLESSRRSMGGLLELLGWDTEVALGAERPWRRDYMLPVSEEDVGQAINGLQIDTDRTGPVSGEDGAEKEEGTEGMNESSSYILLFPEASDCLQDAPPFFLICGEIPTFHVVFWDVW